MSKLAFLTCHLTGTGHLIRTLALARAALAPSALESANVIGGALERTAGANLILVDVDIDRLADLKQGLSGQKGSVRQKR